MNRIFLVYEQIVKHYIDRIEMHDLNQGDSIESEEDIAAAFSVSRGTVRKAMTELESMGYLACSKGKRRTVVSAGGTSAEERYPAVVWRVALMLLNRSEYLDAILNAVQTCAASLGWSLDVFYNSSEEAEQDCITKIKEGNYDGAIVVPFRRRGELCTYNYLRLKEAGIPYVMIGRPHESLTCDAVYADDYSGAYRITELLYKKKCREVAYFYDSTMDSVVSLDRMKGYDDAALRHGQRELYRYDVRDPIFAARFGELLEGNYEKIGLNIYSNELFPMIRAVLHKYGKKKKKDYELVAFFEHSFEDQARYTVMKVPKEIMAQRAVSMLNKRMLTDEGKSVVHEIFEVDLLDV